MENKEKTKETADLKTLIKSRKLIIGREKTLKCLKENTLDKIFLASNCPKALLEEIMHYSKIAGIDVNTLDMPNDELGTFCKKMFSITILGISK